MFIVTECFVWRLGYVLLRQLGLTEYPCHATGKDLSTEWRVISFLIFSWFVLIKIDGSVCLLLGQLGLTEYRVMLREKIFLQNGELHFSLIILVYVYSNRVFYVAVGGLCFLDILVSLNTRIMPQEKSV